MKWTNKGHEYDEFSKEWNDKNNYYIWGAAISGSNFYRKIKDKININGFIDSDISKNGKKIDECYVYSFEDVKKCNSEKFKIIVANNYYDEISKYLISEGLTENKDFCEYKTFNGVFNMYNYNELHMYRMDLSITNKCTLQCEKCNMLMPYFENPQNKSLDSIKEDLDIYFNWVDNLEILNILGGEPFVYPQIIEVMNYIGDNYRDKVDFLNFFSNGTCKLSKEVLETCKKYGFRIQISDYSNGLPYIKEKIDDFVKDLDKYKIEYWKESLNEWLDFGHFETNNSKLNAEEMISFFNKCKPPFRGLSDKKIYFCHLNTSAVEAGLFKNNKNDYFNLAEYSEDKKIELMEFDLGFNEIGYITFCRECKGCSSDNKCYVDVAKQIKKNSVGKTI